MQGSEPVTGKMPVPQVLLLKWKHYIIFRFGFSSINPTYFQLKC